MTKGTDQTVEFGATVAISQAELAKTARLLEEPVPAKGIRLGTQFFLRAAVLLLVTLGAALGFAGWQADKLTRERILVDLESVPEIFRGYEDSQAVTRKAAVRSRAEDAGTKALLAEKGAGATFHNSAVEFIQGLSADKVFFFDERGSLLARSDRAAGEDVGRDFSAVAWVRDPLATRTEASAFILDLKPQPVLSMVAAAPVTQGEGSEMRLNGVIAAAFSVTDKEAERLGRLSGGEAVFVTNVAERGAPPKLQVIAVSRGLRGEPFQRALAPMASTFAPLFGTAESVGVFELALAGETFIGTALPIRTKRAETIAVFAVLKSKEAGLATFYKLRNGLLAIGVLLLVLSLPVSFAMAKQISRPIEKLAEGAEQIRRGRLDVELPPGSGSEVGRLANAFRSLVADLKEKDALEALLVDMQRRPGDLTRPGMSQQELSEGLPSSAQPEFGMLFAGRYEVISKLGEGGMGQVYRARDRQLDDEIALKVLSTGALDTNSAAVTALKQELKTARRISHPNVVRMHDFGEAQAVRFLTMEYVPGTTLRELLEKTGKLDLGPGLQIAKQICRGLSAVHEAGIVHRDVKPQNVMVMGNGVVKLMDFGIASPDDDPKRTREFVEGTPLYMSPEQFRNETLDARSDLYSLGLVVFELFAGKHPFSARSIEEIMQKQLFEDPPLLKTVRPDLPDLLEVILARCLVKEVERRPPSAAELERALTRVTG